MAHIGAPIDQSHRDHVYFDATRCRTSRLGRCRPAKGAHAHRQKSVELVQASHNVIEVCHSSA